MARSRSTEEVFAELGAPRADPASAASVEKLRRALQGRSPHAAARAAEIAAEFEITALEPDLVTAFERFMVNPTRTDKGCAAKTALVSALRRLGHPDEAVFLRALRHVQLEGTFGGKEDTAGGLRAAAAAGLVGTSHPNVLAELGELLADPEPVARAGAARAIAYYGHDHGLALLRLRLRVGDRPEIIGECCTAMLEIDATSSLPLLSSLLNSDDPAIVEATALALGESRFEGAFDALREWWERTLDPELRGTGLIAIATLRSDHALDFLVSLISDAPTPVAAQVLRVLGMFRHDDALRARASAAASERDDMALTEAFLEAFE